MTETEKLIECVGRLLAIRAAAVALKRDTDVSEKDDRLVESWRESYDHLMETIADETDDLLPG